MTSFNVINGLECSLEVRIVPITSNQSPGSNMKSYYNRTLLPFENTMFENIEALTYDISASPCIVGQIEYRFEPKEILPHPGTVLAT